jgi:hypothetical protein
LTIRFTIMLMIMLTTTCPASTVSADRSASRRGRAEESLSESGKCVTLEGRALVAKCPTRSVHLPD